MIILAFGSCIQELLYLLKCVYRLGHASLRCYSAFCNKGNSDPRPLLLTIMNVRAWTSYPIIKIMICTGKGFITALHNMDLFNEAITVFITWVKCTSSSIRKNSDFYTLSSLRFNAVFHFSPFPSLFITSLYGIDPEVIDQDCSVKFITK